MGPCNLQSLSADDKLSLAGKYLTLTMLNLGKFCFETSVEPDQLT